MASQVWNHIGLHGMAVGTFSCHDEAVAWKSMDSSTLKIAKPQLEKHAAWTIFGKTGSLRLSSADAKQNEWRLDGFPVSDFEVLKETLEDKYGITLAVYSMSAAGTQYGISKVDGKLLKLQHCQLTDAVEEGQEFELAKGEEIWSVDLTTVSQCVLPGTNRNELELQFPESDTIEAETDSLVAIRMYVPPDPEADPAEKEAPTAAETLQQTILNSAYFRKTTATADAIVQFSSCSFLTPRGRYSLELFSTFLRMRGPKYDYKIRYDDISRLYLLPKPDEVYMAFVIALDKPIRQGQQRYQYLVLQASKEHDEITVNLEDETSKQEYNNELQPVMRGSYSNLIAKTFKIITKKKVFIPGKFANSAQQACLNCSVRANEGHLYPLEKQFVFIHKPPIIVRFSEIKSVEFQRYAGGASRGFDLCVTLHEADKEYTFSGIDRADHTSLYNFMTIKEINIVNNQVEELPVVKASYNEEEIFGAGKDEDEEDESEDESYGGEDAAKEKEKGSGSSGGSSDDMDDDEMGSEIDEGLDSDLEEARDTPKAEKGEGKKKKKKKKKKESDDEGGDDDDAKVAASPKKKRKKKKDANAPKRAASAYLCFLNANRDRIRAENTNAAFSELSKLGGNEWKKLSAEGRVEYEALAAKDKERYKAEMADYTPPADNDEDDGDDAPAKKKKKKKKVKKDPNAPKKPLTAFFLFSTKTRPKLKQDHPDLSFGDVAKKIGELYGKLTPEEKAEFEEKSAKDKLRYAEEMKAYESTKAADDGVDEDAGGSSDGSD